MAGKSNFTNEEWRQIVESVVLSGTAVTAADPSGLWGTMREGMASMGGLKGFWTGKDDNPLLKDIAEEFRSSEGRSALRSDLKETFAGADHAKIKKRALAAIKEAAQIVEQKAAEDSLAYKRFLKDTAHRVAEAAKEGSILGFGGERVSEAERHALADIERALGLA